MHRRGWQQLKENRKKGVSLAVVLCVSAFFIAFAAAILYTAGLLTSRSSERLQEERSYQLARSFSKVLGTELEAYSQKDDPDAIGTFYQFANLFLDETRYQEYSKDNPKSTSYQFVVDGTTAVCFKWYHLQKIWKADRSVRKRKRKWPVWKTS